ncbi:MAG: hypothetical protein M3Z24_03310, partial [Chloroflexota bacterium]|nr:hypothetical protein [Chloroflexota bacterium]
LMGSASGQGAGALRTGSQRHVVLEMIFWRGRSASKVARSGPAARLLWVSLAGSAGKGSGLPLGAALGRGQFGLQLGDAHLAGRKGSLHIYKSGLHRRELGLHRRELGTAHREGIFESGNPTDEGIFDWKRISVHADQFYRNEGGECKSLGEPRNALNTYPK